MSIYNGRRIPVYYDDGNVGNAAANAIASGLAPQAGSAWGGTTPPSDVKGRAAPGGLAPQLGTQNADPSRNVGRNPDGSVVPVNTNPYNWTYGGKGTPGQTAYSSAAGTGASWGGDGSYKLPSGEVLPAYAHSTVDINGRQVTIPGYYNPQNDQVRFANNGTQETAMDRLTRRLKDDAANGLDPSDPNVIYREMARLADDSAAAGYSAQQTGFVHIDRFQRGGNGETGFVNAAGQANQADPHALAWRTAISNTTGTGAGTPPSSSANPPPTTQTPGAPPVSAQTTPPGIGNGQGAAANAMGTAQSNGMAATSQQATQNGQPSYTGQAPGEILNTPEYAYRAIMERMGLNPDLHGAFSSYLQSHLTNAFSTILKSMQGAGQMPADFNGVLDQIGQQAFGQGGNWMNYTGQMADQGLQRLAGQGNADMETVAPEIQNLLALKATGYNPVATSDMLNSYKQTMGQYMDQGLQNGGADKQSFMPYLLGTNFGRRFMPQP